MNADAAGSPMLRKVGRINGPGDFDKLVAGFKRMRCVTFVANTDDILRPFDQGLESMELILGYRLDESAEAEVRGGISERLGFSAETRSEAHLRDGCLMQRRSASRALNSGDDTGDEESRTPDNRLVRDDVDYERWVEGVVTYEGVVS